MLSSNDENVCLIPLCKSLTIVKTSGEGVPRAVRCGCTAGPPAVAVGCSEPHKEGAQLPFPADFHHLHPKLVVRISVSLGT